MFKVRYYELRTILTFKTFFCRRQYIFLDHRVEHFDLDYLCDKNNLVEISTNIKRRKGPGDIVTLIELNKRFLNSSGDEREQYSKSIVTEALKIPNRCHPDTFSLLCDPKIINEIGQQKSECKRLPFEEISKKLNLTRTENLSNLTGSRSYYLLDQMADLEQALIRYSVDFLVKKGFQLVSVPDILPRQVIEACGMNTTGERTQVYSLDKDIHGKDLCLSGTAEMGIASMLINKTFSLRDLPLKLAAVSRCYRAETSKISEEKGIYRVHSFTKVEMFSVSRPEDSADILAEFVSLEECLFSSLGLCLRTLEMPPEELGAQAFRKYDVEAWLAGKNKWAELSSASDCTDFQSRRLNLRLSDCGHSKYPHTLNGTAAAIPRLVIAIVETHQAADASYISIPQVLQPYLNFNAIVKTQVPRTIPYKGRSFYP